MISIKINLDALTQQIISSRRIRENLEDECEKLPFKGNG
jgi:hypothetical protein